MPMRMGTALGLVSAAAALAVGALFAWWFAFSSVPHTNQQLGAMWGAGGALVGATLSAIGTITNRLCQGKHKPSLDTSPRGAIR